MLRIKNKAKLKFITVLARYFGRTKI